MDIIKIAVALLLISLFGVGVLVMKRSASSLSKIERKPETDMNSAVDTQAPVQDNGLE